MDYYLQHHGVKGMHWGVRRYQNKDGSLTPAGKKRQVKQKQRSVDKAIKNERSQASKNRRTLSDADIDARINRLKKEKQLKELTDADIHPGRTAVKNFMKSSGGRVLTAAATGAMAYGGHRFMENQGWDKAAAYMFPNPHKKK